MTNFSEEVIENLISTRQDIELEPKFHAEIIDGEHVRIDANRDGIFLVAIQLLKMVQSQSKLSKFNIDEASVADVGSTTIVINRIE